MRGRTPPESAGRTLGQAAAALALVALAGCGALGSPVEALTGRPDAPDEFQVLPRQPLRMPTTLALPEPRPGAPSPLDPDPQQAAEVALMGADMRPVATGGSAGEEALLAAANANSAEPGIRRTLASDTGPGSNEPYEPPTIWELFGVGGDDGPPPENMLDPNAEARRLQTEGVAAAPINPGDRPVVEEAGDEPAPSQYPGTTADRRPENKLPSSGTTPAY